MRGRCTSAGERAVVLLVLAIAGIGLSACGMPVGRTTPLGDSAAVTTMSTTTTTTTSTVVPTTTTLNPLLMSCVDYVRLKAYGADPFWRQVWLDVGESEVALGAWCDEFSEGDSAGFAAMNREYQNIVSYLAGGQLTTTTSTTIASEVLAPSPTAESTTPPTDTPPATEGPPVTEGPQVTEGPATEPPATDPPTTLAPPAETSPQADSVPSPTPTGV